MNVFLVTFDSPERAKKYVDANRPPWPVLIDADREVYGALGMGRASWWTLLKPSTLWKYFRMWRLGTKPQEVGIDVRQLGGDLLIDPDGRTRLVHVSEGPHDRPSPARLLAVVQGGD